MSEIVFFLEEPSAEAMLDGLLPRLLPAGVQPRCIVFEGKQDLEKQLVRKLRGYRVPNAKFVVLRDKDAGDCRTIKQGLLDKCREAKKADALVRIACHELESWYLADLAAVERGLDVNNLVRFQDKKPYRSPDSLPTPSVQLTQIAPAYQKVAGSRAIGPHLDLENERSTSFRSFINGIRKIYGPPSMPFWRNKRG